MGSKETWLRWGTKGWRRKHDDRRARLWWHRVSGIKMLLSWLSLDWLDSIVGWYLKLGCFCRRIYQARATFEWSLMDGELGWSASSLGQWDSRSSSRDGLLWAKIELLNREWNWNDHVGNFRGSTVNEGLYFCQWKMVLWFIRGGRGFIYYQINR